MQIFFPFRVEVCDVCLSGILDALRRDVGDGAVIVLTLRLSDAVQKANAKDGRNAYAGAVTGALCLGALTILLLRALLTDMAFSSALDLPMLAADPPQADS